MRNHKLKVLSVALLLLSGCSNTGSNGGSGTTSANEEATTLENPVRLDQLGVLPASNSSAASYLLQLTNYSKDKYTLDSVRVIDLDTGKDSELVSVASQACSTVSANGSCSIQLTPHTAKSADVKLEVNLKDNQGKSKTLYQLIRVSSKLNAKTAGIAMVNDVSRIVSEDGNYSLSIPVVLGESYDDIKASNGSLICNTEGYQKGSSCTYQVSGKASGTGAVISTRLEGVKSGKVVTVQEANTKVEIGKGAHLLLSHGTVINTPETSGEIIIFNSGNTAAASVTPTTTDTNLQLGTAAANPCQATIAEGETCKVKVDVAGNTNGQGVVTVAYKDGANDHKAVSNVEYTVANAEAGVSFTQNNSNLENALIGGKPRTAEIEIKNTGNRSLSNIKYYLAPANGDFKVVAGSDPACGLDGKHTLAAGASCHVKVEYKPTSEKTGGSINLVLNGEYTDQHGQEHSLVKEHGLSYSATKAGPLSWIHREGNQNLVILSNNTDKREAVWDLSNTIAFDEGLSAKLSSDVSLNPNDVAGLSVVAEEAGSCGIDAEIPGNAKCSYKVTYGPVPTPQTAIDVALQAQYTLGGEAKITDSAKFQVVASATAIANILTKVTVKNGPSGLLGTGELLNPYSFTALSSNTLELNYTFKNEGTAEAPSFNVAAASLPAGTSVIGGDCPTGTETGALGAGASCTTTVSVPNSRLFDAPNLTTSTLNGAKLDISLPYSYSKDGSIVLENQPANRTYAQFSRLWGTISQTTESNNETNSDYTFDIKSTVNVPTGVSGVSKPITVRPYLANPISGATLQSCTIAADKDSCINKLTLPKSMFTPGAKLNVSFAAKGTGMADKDAIINTFPLIIANPDVKLSLDTQYEPVWYTNAEGLDVLPGNHGYIHLTNAGISNSGKVTAKVLQQAEVIDNECATSGVSANGECYIEVKATGANPIVQVTSEYGATLTYLRHQLGKYGRIQGVISGSNNATAYPEATTRPLRIQGDALTLANGTLWNNLSFYAGDIIGQGISSSTEYPPNTQLSALIQNHFQVTLGQDGLRLTHVPEIIAEHLGTHASGRDIIAVRTAFIDTTSHSQKVPGPSCIITAEAYTELGSNAACDYTGAKGPTVTQRKASRERIYREILAKGNTGEEGYANALQQVTLKDTTGRSYPATAVLGSTLYSYSADIVAPTRIGGTRPALLGGVYTTTASGLNTKWGNFSFEDENIQGSEFKSTFGTGGTYRFEVYLHTEKELPAGTYKGELIAKLGQSANIARVVQKEFREQYPQPAGQALNLPGHIGVITGRECRTWICEFHRTTNLTTGAGAAFDLTPQEKSTFVTVKIPIQVDIR